MLNIIYFRKIRLLLTESSEVQISVSNNQEDILAAIHSGRNSKALNYLYETVLVKVRRHVLNNSGGLDDANDLFQDAVIVLFDYVKAGKFEKNGTVDGFVYRVAKNLWIDKLRRRKIMEKSDGDIMKYSFFHTDSGLQQMISEERLQAIKDVFGRLGEKCKELLYLQLHEKLDMKEISKRLGYTNENVAKSKNYKCKQKLAQLIRDDKEIYNTLRG